MSAATAVNDSVARPGTNGQLRQAVVAPTSRDVPKRPTGREENTSDREELMTRLFENKFAQKDSDDGSLKEQQKSSEHVVECPVEREGGPENDGRCR